MVELSAVNVAITGDSSGLSAAVNSATKEMGKLPSAATSAARSTTGLTGAFGRLSTMSGGTRSQIQNVGYQLQDMAVQFQAGTNASVVFAQQGSQLLSVLGPVGSILGTVAAISLPALAFAFAATGSEAATFEDDLDRLKSAMEALDGATEILTMSVDDLLEKYGQAGSQARAFAVAQAEALVAVARRELAQQVTAVGDLAREYSAFGAVIGDLGETLVDPLDNVRRLEKDFGVTRAEAWQLANAFEGLANSPTFEGQTEALADIDRLLKASGVSASTLPPELNDALIAMRDNVFAAYELEAALNRAASAASDMDFGNIRALAGLSGEDLLPPAPGDEPPSRGGRGRSDPLPGQLAALQQSLMTQEEAQIASFERQQEILVAALDQQLLTRQEYADLVQDTEAQHIAAMESLQRRQTQGTLGAYSQMFRNLEGVTRAGGEKTLSATKALSSSVAVVDALAGYNRALADPTVPSTLVRQVLAASSLAAGAANVAAINSTQLGARSVGGAATAQTPTVTNNLTANISVTNSGGTLTPDSIVAALESAVAGGRIFQGA